VDLLPVPDSSCGGDTLFSLQVTVGFPLDFSPCSEVQLDSPPGLGARVALHPDHVAERGSVDVLVLQGDDVSDGLPECMRVVIQVGVAEELLGRGLCCGELHPPNSSAGLEHRGFQCYR